MNSLWNIGRILYGFGLIPVVLLLFVGIVLGTGDGVALIVVCAAYIVIGALLFKITERWFRSRLLTGVERARLYGFSPQFEVVSIAYDNYIGFDPILRKILYINGARETLVNFDEVIEWRIEKPKGSPPTLKLLTRRIELPVASIVFSRRRVDECEARIITLFG
uniref:hypothetical protein n=1 Tax=Burkholderia diffusa TaxID=488732 RepID=UPI001CC76A07|nr:hypothetical protein [Burkholderia diffusa]